MSDPILDIESSEQDSSPRELIDISYGTTTHSLTYADHDLVDNGQLYVATPGERSTLGPVGVGNPEKELTLTLPINHAFTRRYLALGLPPRNILVTIRRKYFPSGNVEQAFVGEIVNMRCNDQNTEAEFRVLARAGKALLRVIPSVTAGRTCPHPLYSKMCRINKAGTNPDAIPYTLTTSVIDVNGRDVRIDLSTVPAGNGNRADWLERGELIHIASGESMTIQAQNDLNPGISTVTDVSLQAQILGLKVGDQVTVVAGCKQEMSVCNGKFGNRHNFGGFNRMPTKNIFRPSDTGPTFTGEF